MQPNDSPRQPNEPPRQKDETIAASAQSSLASQLVLPLRILLATMCLGGVLFWSYGMLVIAGYYGRGVFASSAVFQLLVPYLYLFITLYCCFKKLSIKTLIILGAVLNAPLVALFIYFLTHFERYVGLNAFVPLAYVLGWSFLLLALWFAEHGLSTRKRAVTIAVLAGVLLLGAVAVFPLTVDHESEALTFLQAANDGSPDEARANFAESLRHAIRIRRKSERVQMIQQIAMGQARRKLYDDANTTRAYLDNGADEGDRDWLTDALVLQQLRNQDYSIALATARPMNSAGRFQIQRLTLEADSRAQEGQTEAAREILETAITLADEQPNQNTRTYAYAFIAEAQAKIGWHDGALASAQKYGAENSIGLLGSIGVNEAEAGYKDSARQTLQVIYGTVNEAMGNCLQRPTVAEKDRCLSELVDELGDDQFFRLARTAAERISTMPKRDLAGRSVSEFEARFLNVDLEDRIKK
jgi:hypothetical protein